LFNNLPAICPALRVLLAQEAERREGLHFRTTLYLDAHVRAALRVNRHIQYRRPNSIAAGDRWFRIRFIHIYYRFRNDLSRGSLAKFRTVGIQLKFIFRSYVRFIFTKLILLQTLSLKSVGIGAGMGWM
jgi:hypothetical protein